MEEEFLVEDWLHSYLSVPILDVKYEKAAIYAVIADKQSHLSDSQNSDLRSILMKNGELFSRKLGHYPHQQIYIDVDENAILFHSHPYPVPHVLLGAFKHELDHFCAIGVLSQARVNGHPKLLFPPKRTVTDVGSGTFEKSIRLSNGSNIHCPSLLTFCASNWATIPPPSSIFQCSTTSSSWMKCQGISAQ